MIGNRLQRFSLPELFQSQIHTFHIKISLGCGSVGGMKNTGDMLSAVSQLVAHCFHTEGGSLQRVEILLCLLGNTVVLKLLGYLRKQELNGVCDKLVVFAHDVFAPKCHSVGERGVFYHFDLGEFCYLREGNDMNVGVEQLVFGVFVKIKGSINGGEVQMILFKSDCPTVLLVISFSVDNVI